MNYKKLFGYGVIIWGALYLIATLFVGYKMGNSIYQGISMIVAAAVLGFIFGKMLHIELVKDMIKYSVGWVLIGLILDLILTVPFTGSAIYFTPSYWVSYLLILTAPMFAAKK